jgi:hypothetical protein
MRGKGERKCKELGNASPDEVAEQLSELTLRTALSRNSQFQRRGSRNAPCIERLIWDWQKKKAIRSSEILSGENQSGDAEGKLKLSMPRNFETDTLA